MMNFLGTVKASMTASRRLTPLPQDFIFALAESGLESHHLDPHLRLALPDDIANPTIQPPRLSEAPPPDLAPMLGHELATPATQQYGYIPSHFPPLPSRHAWQSTNIFTDREKDPRRIRERATDEGVQAEHALRKLTTANKSRSRQPTVDKAKDKLWQDTIADLLEDDDHHPSTTQDADGDIRLDGFSDGYSSDKATIMADLVRGSGSLMVNHDRSHWRRGRGAVHIWTVQKFAIFSDAFFFLTTRSLGVLAGIWAWKELEQGEEDNHEIPRKSTTHFLCILRSNMFNVSCVP
jgi:transcription initiation factor TFIID subunit 8